MKLSSCKMVEICILWCQKRPNFKRVKNTRNQCTTGNPVPANPATFLNPVPVQPNIGRILFNF